MSEYVCHLSFKTWIQFVSGFNKNTLVLVSNFRQFKSKMSIYLLDFLRKQRYLTLFDQF